MTDRDQPTEADESVGPVVHDRRRIDPETGALREGAAASRATVHPTGVVGGDPLAAAQAEAAERLERGDERLHVAARTHEEARASRIVPTSTRA